MTAEVTPILFLRRQLDFMIKLEESEVLEQQEYMNLLHLFERYIRKEALIVVFGNGLKVKCQTDDIGIIETSIEPDEEDFIGEYVTIVKVVEILAYGVNNSVSIFNNYIEISLANIPEKISLEDGTVLWQK